jgi:hypothetical protein
LSIYLPDEEAKVIDYIAFDAEPTPVCRLISPGSLSRDSGRRWNAAAAQGLSSPFAFSGVDRPHGKQVDVTGGYLHEEKLITVNQFRSVSDEEVCFLNRPY